MEEPKPLTILSDPSRDCDYDDVNVDDINHIAIFPPVGISRVGDSDECFLAPEVPGHTSPPQALLKGTEFKFRDAEQKLRRQAVRFRVYAYNEDNKVIGELNAKNHCTLTWRVEVANKKAAGYVFQRNARFGPRDATLRNPMIQPDEGLENRTRLIVKAEGEISGTTEIFIPLQGCFQGSRKKEDAVKVDLAQLQLDEAGRLIFLPGKGGAQSVANRSKPRPPVTSEFDNADWIDEICDGSVTVKVTKDNKTFDAIPAWVLSAPPKFAWGINAPTTLYDIMEDIYYRAAKPAPPVQVDFWRHIWPVLHSPSLMSWTNSTAFQGHGQFSAGHFDVGRLLKLFRGETDDPKEQEKRKDFKTEIFEKLRKPLDETKIDNTQADVRYMPLLSGDYGDMPDSGTFPRDLQPDARKFASLTKLQYERFRVWKDDDNFYLTDNDPPVPKSKLEDLKEPSDQPEQLTRAILEPTIGDPLFPGIEMYWIVKREETFDTTETRINPPFRIRQPPEEPPEHPPEHPFILPGHLTRGLSLPWQCDFDLCQTHWWPATRPDDVVPRVVFDATVQNSDQEDDFIAAITTRTKWTRGLRETVFFSVTQPDWAGSDDMINYWTQLGVVREVKVELGEKKVAHTTFLEDERGSL